jgi:hypothetical protein
VGEEMLMCDEHYQYNVMADKPDLDGLQLEHGRV